MELIKVNEKMVIESINPATLEKNGEVDETSIDELKKIYEKARVAQREWRARDACTRARTVVGVNSYLSTHIDEISIMISKEVGKTPLESFITEVYGAMDAAYYYYTVAPDILERKASLDLRFYNGLHKNSYIVHKPAGVISVIGPYNYPFVIPFGQIVQSLMAGNAIVFKPSSDTVLVGRAIQVAFDAVAGLPKDLVNTVFGNGSVLGNVMIDEADRVIFTGSTETGKAIMRRAADTLTPVCLELGGKSAMVVLPDANLERAALAARWGCFLNSGQVCSSVKRLYVHESIADRFTKKLVDLTNRLKQGNPMDKGIDVGAMVNERQMAKVLQAIDAAVSEGAKVLTGGRRNPDLKGYFIEPTILGGCTNAMECVQREIFGPVLAMVTFEDEEEAIRMVNDSPFGLTSSVWTADIEKGEDIAKRIDTGTCMINEVVYTFGLAMTPWGGVKASGIGRTHGEFGFYEVTDPLHVNVDTSTDPDPWWMPYGPDFEDAMENFKLVARSLVVTQEGCDK